RALYMGIETAHRESIPGCQITLELRSGGQLLSSRCQGIRTIRDRATLRVQPAAVVLLQLGVHQRGAGVDREAHHRRPFELSFDSLDARVAGIGDARHGIGPKESELEVLPIFPEERAVEAQTVVEPGRLPSNLIAGEKVRLVGWQIADTIHATGPEALCPGSVHHDIRGDLVLQADLRRPAAL